MFRKFTLNHKTVAVWYVFWLVFLTWFSYQITISALLAIIIYTGMITFVVSFMLNRYGLIEVFFFISSWLWNCNMFILFVKIIDFYWYLENKDDYVLLFLLFVISGLFTYSLFRLWGSVRELFLFDQYYQQIKEKHNI